MPERPPKPTDRAASPRSRKRQPQPSRKPPFIPHLPVNTHIDPSVSMPHQRLVGRVIILWSKLEGAIQTAIWEILNIDFEDGRALTASNQAEANLVILQTLAARHLPELRLESFPALLEKIRACQEQRNAIAHGQWVTIRPLGVPAVMSIRARSEFDKVMTETFPPTRMYEIIKDITFCVTELSGLRSELEASLDKQKRPPP